MPEINNAQQLMNAHTKLEIESQFEMARAKLELKSKVYKELNEHLKMWKGMTNKNTRKNNIPTLKSKIIDLFQIQADIDLFEKRQTEIQKLDNDIKEITHGLPIEKILKKFKEEGIDFENRSFHLEKEAAYEVIEELELELYSISATELINIAAAYKDTSETLKVLRRNASKLEGDIYEKKQQLSTIICTLQNKNSFNDFVQNLKHENKISDKSLRSLDKCAQQFFDLRSDTNAMKEIPKKGDKLVSEAQSHIEILKEHTQIACSDITEEIENLLNNKDDITHQFSTTPNM